MPGWLLRWGVNTLALLLAGALLGGVTVADPIAGIVAAGLLALINVSIRPILIIVTLPINLLTLGLFTFVVNALMIMLVAWLVPGFVVAGFWWSVLTAFVIAFVNAVVSVLVPNRRW